MKNSPGHKHANSWAATLSWHWHRPAVTPLPGVSAPAGLRPSPLAPLFAAAQPSLCPVPAGKAVYNTVSDKLISGEGDVWGILFTYGYRAPVVLPKRDAFFVTTQQTYFSPKRVECELTCGWICPLAVCTTICSPVVVVAVVYCSMASHWHGDLLRLRKHVQHQLTLDLSRLDFLFLRDPQSSSTILKK